MGWAGSPIIRPDSLFRGQILVVEIGQDSDSAADLKAGSEHRPLPSRAEDG